MAYPANSWGESEPLLLVSRAQNLSKRHAIASVLNQFEHGCGIPSWGAFI